MRKYFVSLLGFLLCLVGCAIQTPTPNEKIQVVVTIFPEYDWSRELIQGVEDQYELTLLLENGVDFHNYQPTTDDMLKISTADLFIYVGGESDAWVEDTRKVVTNPNQKVCNLMEILQDQLLEEEMVEGMEEDEEEEEEAFDEHIWFSLDHAMTVCESIQDALIEIDPENKALYQENYLSYQQQLQDMKEKYETTLSSRSHNLLLFADRFPFRYLTEDYGISYYAAFKGCSAETEASFETIRFLTEQVKQNQLDYICVTESSDQKIAETIMTNSEKEDITILVFDSMQAITKQDIQNGVTYLSLFEQNLSVLTKALE